MDVTAARQSQHEQDPGFVCRQVARNNHTEIGQAIPHDTSSRNTGRNNDGYPYLHHSS